MIENVLKTGLYSSRLLTSARLTMELIVEMKIPGYFRENDLIRDIRIDKEAVLRWEVISKDRKHTVHISIHLNTWNNIFNCFTTSSFPDSKGLGNGSLEAALADFGEKLIELLEYENQEN